MSEYLAWLLAGSAATNNYQGQEHRHSLGGRPDPAWQLILHTPYLFNRALPCDFPCIVICEHLHRYTFALSPVTSIGSLSHVLISLKLQFTWIAVHGPERIPSHSPLWLELAPEDHRPLLGSKTHSFAPMFCVCPPGHILGKHVCFVCYPSFKFSLFSFISLGKFLNYLLLLSAHFLLQRLQLPLPFLFQNIF